MKPDPAITRDMCKGVIKAHLLGNVRKNTGVHALHIYYMF